MLKIKKIAAMFLAVGLSAIAIMLYQWVQDIGVDIYIKYAYLVSFFDDVYLLDTICCTMLIVLYSIWLFFMYKFSKRKSTGSEEALSEDTLIPETGHRNRERLNSKRLIETVVITFGLSGISFLWLNFVDYILINFPAFSESAQRFEEAWSDEDQSAYIWVFLSVAVLGPIVEELLFRGVVFNHLEKAFGKWLTVIVSSLAFGIWHGELVQIVYTCIVGLGIAIVYIKTRNLVYPICLHILNNFMSTLPDSLNTPFVTELLDKVCVVAIIPCIYLLVKYIREELLIDKEKRLLNLSVK
ncbi:MAG: CPBP family intramembrane glutamic endopeptidase [Eubacterium sp.]|nr:CPBP family intramembrane glutamic endopeptidase [Eubacterium sp.]